jgi:hypothetical protein
MIRRTMREMLQYITTQMIGERTPEEIEAGKKNFITAKRWTKIDDEIEKLNGIIDENNDSDIKNRMAFLKKIGLADKKDNIYKVKENWKNTLMVTGRYNSFFDEYIKLNGKLEFYSGNEVKGKILKIVSFDKDESWNDAIIVRTDENRCIYVPVWKLKRKDLSGKNVVIPGGKNNLSRQISDKDIHIDSQPTVKNISEKIKNNESQKR